MALRFLCNLQLMKSKKSAFVKTNKSTLNKKWSISDLIKESAKMMSSLPEWKQEFAKNFCPINNKGNTL